jgi:hypothetical protein
LCTSVGFITPFISKDNEENMRAVSIQGIVGCILLSLAEFRVSVLGSEWWFEHGMQLSLEGNEMLNRGRKEGKVG